MRYCSVDNCNQPVFGTDKVSKKGFCRNHQYMRHDKKLKSIPKYTQKERIRTYDFGFEDQISMFQTLWDNAGDEKGRIICPFTGTRLNGFFGTDLWINCFAHVLPKGRYTYWKLNPINIRIVFPLFHSCVDQGTIESRKNHPDWKFSVWDKEVEELKLQYSNFKKLNLLS